MSAAHPAVAVTDPRQVRAWVLYDWANSAFVTTVVAAVFPVYFADVAGATLPSAARATQVFSLATSASLVVVALLSPVLGAYSDLAGAKKRLLGLAMGVGAVATGALVLVGEGDWLLGAALFGLGRIGFGIANVFYDALLPAVAAPEDRDRVSARGYALGYVGGGLVLAANVVLILLLPDDALGVRLSFLTVAVWWVVFSLPLLRTVREPPAAAVPGGTAGLRASLRQTRVLWGDLRAFDDLRRFLFAFVVYNDAINVVIGVAAIYGNELGFATDELLLAILLVQFVGAPYALLWGRLPHDPTVRRARVLAFLVANVVFVPVLGVVGRVVLPADVTGTSSPAPATVVVDGRVHPGEGELLAPRSDTAESTGVLADEPALARPVAVGDTLVLGISSVGLETGQDVTVTWTAGPDVGHTDVLVDGRPAVGPDGGPVELDASSTTRRAGEEVTVRLDRPGLHVLELRPTDRPGAETAGAVTGATTFTSVVVDPPRRVSDLAAILGLLVALQVLVGAAAWVVGPRLLRDVAARIRTEQAIQLTLVAYLVVAVWGFALDAVIEFWALAWLVAVVQGGSQALSRSLFSALVPPARTGEFFGLFSILSKVASFVSPLLFVASVALFDTSRPAVLALAGLFGGGMLLLRRVDVPAGRRRAAASAAAPDGAR